MKLLEASTAAVHTVYCLEIGQHKAQDSNSPNLVDDLQEICRHLPDDEYLTPMVKSAAEVLEIIGTRRGTAE